MKKYIKFGFISIAFIIYLLMLSSCGGDIENTDALFIVDGKTYESIEVVGGDSIKLPPEPKIEGYKFSGWYYNDDTGEQLIVTHGKIQNPKDGDFAVYAKFEKDYTSHVHTLVHYEKVVPNCEKDGNIEYWQCSVCEKTYSDELCTVEVFDVKTTHTNIGVKHPSTCTEKGFIIYHCVECGMELLGETLPENHNYENGICKDCGRFDMPEDGETLEFGSYPQSEVIDKALSDELTSIAGVLPKSNTSENGSWVRYPYYISGVETSFMWYKDIEYEGEKYRGVYFTSYRPNFSNSERFSVDLKNPPVYLRSIVHWFKFEPLEWRIVYEDGGIATLLCENVIDSQEFNIKGLNNSYSSSSIRQWLNNDFYNIAFDSSERWFMEMISINDIQDNTSDGLDDYDNVYLLSKDDLKNKNYGFNTDFAYKDAERKRIITDYARCQSMDVRSELKSETSKWMLSSENKDDGFNICAVNEQGQVCNYDYNSWENGCEITENLGVCPAIKINLLRYTQSK